MSRSQRPCPAPDATRRFLATAARGTEPLLRAELEALGATDVTCVPGGVTFAGDLLLGMRACLWLRTATRVQMLLGEGRVSDERSLYEAVRALDLAPWFAPEHTLAVTAHINDRRFRNSHFAALKIKDAIVDVMRDRYGARPDVAAADPDVLVSAYVIRGELRLFLAMQGRDALNLRGYRARQVEAPLKESLAAALLLFGGWRGQAPIVDPMCGSGTIAIEAALIASDTAPGLARHFGFERWPAFKDVLAAPFEAMLEEARERSQQNRDQVVSVVASDLDPRAVGIAKNNVRRAGVADLVTVRRADARNLDPLSPPGAIVTNPPYGERIGGTPEDSRGLLAELGQHLRTFDQHTLTLLAPRATLKGALRMKPARRSHIFNGRIEVDMAHYLIGREHALRATGRTTPPHAPVETPPHTPGAPGHGT